MLPAKILCSSTDAASAESITTPVDGTVSGDTPYPSAADAGICGGAGGGSGFCIITDGGKECV